FFSKGLTRAVLKQEGKVDSVRQRLISVVIGCNRVSRQDLRMTVGMKSSGQVASEEARIAPFISSLDASLKSESPGGGVGGMRCCDRLAVGRVICSFVI